MPTYDVFIQVVPAAAQSVGGKFLSFGTGRSLGVGGIQKLLNEFTIALLTPVGTDPLDLFRGTDLPNLIGSNVAIDDAQEILTLAVQKATQDILSYQVGIALPEDEQLAAATITEYLVIEDAPGFSARIFVQNVAQQGLTLLLPSLQTRTP